MYINKFLITLYNNKEKEILINKINNLEDAHLLDEGENNIIIYIRKDDLTILEQILRSINNNIIMTKLELT